jgi:hypothetical protein
VIAPIAAVALVVILGALAVFQIALIAGAPLGHFAWGGQDRILPSRKRIGSVISIVLYGVIAGIALARAGLIPGEREALGIVIAMWVVFAYFAAGIVLNGISRSIPERAVMTPTVAVLAVLALLIALGL